MKINDESITVKELRESRGVSRREVAVALNIADSTVLRWETGQNTPHISLDGIKTLLTLYRCDFDTLYSAFAVTAQMKKLAKEGTPEVSKRVIEYEVGEPQVSEEEADKIFEGSPMIKVRDRLG